MATSTRLTGAKNGVGDTQPYFPRALASSMPSVGKGGISVSKGAEVVEIGCDGRKALATGGPEDARDAECATEAGHSRVLTKICMFAWYVARH